MLFSVGVELAKNKDELNGIVVPVFDKFGYGCNSASESEDKIISNAIDAILTISYEMILDGLDLSLLQEGYADYSDDKKYSLFTRWIYINVELSSIEGKQARINTSLPDGLISRIDSRVANDNKYRDRSHFLSVASSLLLINESST